MTAEFFFPHIQEFSEIKHAEGGQVFLLGVHFFLFYAGNKIIKIVITHTLMAGHKMRSS
jgi:hypothetical protein